MATGIEQFSLAGRRALVTGSSQGIGQALARGLAEAGASVVLNGRDEARLLSAVEALRRDGLAADARAFDVTDHDLVRAAVDAIEAEIGPIDILVNNAGMQHREPLETFPPDIFERMMQTNIASLYHVGQAVGRHMIGRGAGRIINIASVMSRVARAGVAPYTATKGAVANLTKGMATDWGPKGITCNAVAPGYIDTPLTEALVNDPEFNDWLSRRTPLGRWAKPEELVGATVFLASDAAAFVNGHTLFVDGGITATL